MTGLKEKEVGFITELLTIEKLLAKKSQFYECEAKDETVKEKMSELSGKHETRAQTLLKNLE